jgi:hypothetical protein
MKLTASDLRALADNIEKLAKVDVDLTSFHFRNLRIDIRRKADQRDGAWVEITSISDIEL